MNIYLAGPIDGCSYEEAHGWRNDLTRELAGGYQHHFFNPLKLNTTQNGVVDADMRAIAESDAVVAHCWKPSIGTSMEIALSTCLYDVPVLTLMPRAEITDITPFSGSMTPIHPWIAALSNTVMFYPQGKWNEFMPRLAQGVRSFVESLDQFDTDMGALTMSSKFSRHAQPLRVLAQHIHRLNRPWWQDLNTGAPIERNFGELLMLATSELAEALEGNRRNLNDDHLPERKMEEAELADAIIRILDTSAGMGLDVPGALVEKLVYNSVRSDHKVENRLKENGKKY